MPLQQRHFYSPNNLLISFSFISASTGVSVLISIFRMSSLICNNVGSSNWIRLSWYSPSGFFLGSGR